MLASNRLTSWMKVRTLMFGVMVLACTAAAAAYPDKPITLIVPFAPGGSSDNVARAMAPLLSEKLGQSVVIENVGGAGGVLGTQRTVRAAPDGYTLLVGSGSEVLINKVINPNLSYDGLLDLVPITFFCRPAPFRRCCNWPGANLEP